MRGKTPVFSLVFLLSLAATPAQFDARQATVIIDGEIHTPQGLFAETGAGVIIAQNGGLEILTAYHVAEHEHLKVTTWDGEVLDVIKVVHLLPRDLAIIKTSFSEDVYPAIKTTAAANPGSRMFTYGAPNDEKWLLSSGSIRDSRLVPEQFANGEFAMTCSTCDNGSSGGGIFDQEGELEGILIGGYPAQDGVYTFIGEPVPSISSLLASL